MPRVIVRLQAELDVDEIAARIAADNLDAALRFLNAVENAHQLLATWPRSGARRITRNPNLRGLRSYPIRRFRDYLIFYLPLEDGVEIVRVIHGARDLPTVLRQS